MAPRIDKHRQSLMKAASETILHPAEVAVLLYDNARQNAPRRRLEFDIDVRDVIAAVESGLCPRTGRPFDMRRGAWLPDRASLDRIINHIGYVEGNWEVTTNHYNKAKCVYSNEQVLQLALDIVRQAGYEVKNPYPSDGLNPHP